MACKNGDLDTASLLLKKGYTVDSLSDSPGKPLHTAVENGDKQVVQFILEKDLNLSDAKIYKALEISVNGNHVEIAEIICNHGGNFNPGKYETILLNAVNYNEYSMVKMLLEHEVSPDSQMPGGKSALTIAASKNTDIVILLVENGANVNQKDNLGLTPLMTAAKYGKADIVAFLLAHDADPTLRDKSGWTAYDFAKVKGNKEVIDLFKYHNMMQEINHDMSELNLKPLNPLKALQMADIFETQKPIQALEKPSHPVQGAIGMPEPISIDLLKITLSLEYPSHIDI
jgi:ankyrin repeat protein